MNPLFPSPPSDAEINRLLEHVVRAPSVLNTQPWRFVVDMGAVHIYADHSRQLPGLDPLGREITVSCGAAAFYLRVAARQAGWDTVVLPFPLQQAPDLVAAVTFRPCPLPGDDDPLFRALATRRTDRRSFSSAPLPPGIAAELIKAASAEDATVHVFEAVAEKDALAWLVDAGAGDKGRLIREAPAAVVLSTAGDDRSDWLTAGQALARVLVVAAQYGLVSSYADEPVESDGLRTNVAALIGGGYPQVVFRIGYPEPEPAPATAQRPAHDVTTHAGSTVLARPSGLNAPGSAEESLAEAEAVAAAVTVVSAATGTGVAEVPVLGVAR